MNLFSVFISRLFQGKVTERCVSLLYFITLEFCFCVLVVLRIELEASALNYIPSVHLFFLSVLFLRQGVLVLLKLVSSKSLLNDSFPNLAFVYFSLSFFVRTVRSFWCLLCNFHSITALSSMPVHILLPQGRRHNLKLSHSKIF